MTPIMQVPVRFLFICSSFAMLNTKVTTARSAAAAAGGNRRTIRQQVERSSDDVRRVIDYVMRGEGRHVTYNRLAHISDTFGNRLVGSAALDSVLDYAVSEMNKEEFSNVHKEEVVFPAWKRGAESAKMVKPWVHPLPMLGLGSSVGTNGTVLEADAVVVNSFDELGALDPDKVKGRIVVYNQPWDGYGVSATYRSYGAARAAEKGAVGALVRSVTGYSLATPHTGHQDYADGVKKIPVACITVEDAQMMRRLQENGQSIRLQMYMEAENLPDGISYNVVGELTGTEFPNETIILGGHVDSWDVGTGSLDDGGGFMIAWQVLSTLKKLKLRPRRTLRVVLWTAEEFGTIGAQAYFKAHNADINRVSLVMESDIGTFRPNGIGFTGSKAALSIMGEVMNQLAALNASTIKFGAGGSSDTGKWVQAGVPGVELSRNESNDRYFNYHHSNADTMTALNADDLDLCTVVWATVAYSVANLDKLLPRDDAPPPAEHDRVAEKLSLYQDDARDSRAPGGDVPARSSSAERRVDGFEIGEELRGNGDDVVDVRHQDLARSSNFGARRLREIWRRSVLSRTV